MEKLLWNDKWLLHQLYTFQNKCGQPLKARPITFIRASKTVNNIRKSTAKLQKAWKSCRNLGNAIEILKSCVMLGKTANCRKAWKSCRKMGKSVECLEKPKKKALRIFGTIFHILSHPAVAQFLSSLLFCLLPLSPGFKMTHARWSNECHSWVEILWHYHSSCVLSVWPRTLEVPKVNQCLHIIRNAKWSEVKYSNRNCPFVWSSCCCEMMTQNASECNCCGFRVRRLGALDAGSLHGIDGILLGPQRSSKKSLDAGSLHGIDGIS